MPRTPAEREKTEKRIKLEKTIIPIACILCVAAFILISTLLGKTRIKETGTSAAETPEPTASPCAELIGRIAAAYGGSATESDNSASVSFISGVDGRNVAVSSYLSSGAVCLRIMRNTDPADFSVIQAPAATESIFVVDQTEGAGEETVTYDCSRLSEEITGILSMLSAPEDADALKAALSDKLTALLSGASKKASVISGERLIELEFSASDGILKVSFEPV